jgi:hypothetical protein
MTAPSQHPQNPAEVLIDFQLTLADTNTILQSLAQRPYAEVANLIHGIQRVAQAKVSATTAPSATTEQQPNVN